MSAKQKSQRGFVAVTLITLLALALVVIVYATLLGTFQGGDVTVVAVEGDIYYSLDNSTSWTDHIDNYPITDPWYARFNVTSTDGYSGDVNATWNLHNSTSIVHTVTTTTFPLSGSPEAIYASSDGSQGTNYDWGQNTTVADTYYIEVIVETIS